MKQVDYLQKVRRRHHKAGRLSTEIALLIPPSISSAEARSDIVPTTSVCLQSVVGEPRTTIVLMWLSRVDFVSVIVQIFVVTLYTSKSPLLFRC